MIDYCDSIRSCVIIGENLCHLLEIIPAVIDQNRAAYPERKILNY